MAIADKLTKLSNDIINAYDAIDDKGGTIPANKNTDNLEDAIRSISSGHLDNTEYAEANDDLDDILEGSTPVTIYPPDWSEIGYEDTPEDIINAFNYSKNIKDNWNSSITTLYYVYYNDKNLVYMPPVDTTNVTNISYAFYNCSNLKEIPLLDTTNVTNMQSAFSNCSSLKNIPVLDTQKVTNMSSTFTGCTNLSNESLNNILQMCINTTNAYTGFKSLQWIGINTAQATICEGLSNWDAFVAAGWTKTT